MMDFEKLRKHTENALAYELDGEELFTIKPEVSDRTSYLMIKKRQARNKSEDIKPYTDFLYQLFVRDSEGASDEERTLVKQFIENNIDELTLQTDIGFKLTTRAKIAEQEAKIMETLMSKNLM